MEIEDSRAYIYCLRIEGLIPYRVEPAHTTGEVGAIPILGMNVVRIL
jgi:hypothetical protein